MKRLLMLLGIGVFAFSVNAFASTNTFTNTATATETNTTTGTKTPTALNTATATYTATVTKTLTSSVTATNTATLTWTISNTKTSSMTLTSSRTYTPTFTPTSGPENLQTDGNGHPILGSRDSLGQVRNLTLGNYLDQTTLSYTGGATTSLTTGVQAVLTPFQVPTPLFIPQGKTLWIKAWRANAGQIWESPIAVSATSRATSWMIDPQDAMPIDLSSTAGIWLNIQTSGDGVSIRTR